MSPTARTLAWLRSQGYAVAVVEHWNAFARRRIDAFGYLDLIAVHRAHRGVLGVQATSGANVAHRVAKIASIPEARTWLAAGNRIWVVGWRKIGPRGKRKKWEPLVRAIVEEDLGHDG